MSEKQPIKIKEQSGGTDSNENSPGEQEGGDHAEEHAPHDGGDVAGNGGDDH